MIVDMMLPVFLFLVLVADESAALLPGGPGKDVVSRICTDCHDTSNIRKLRMARDGWSEKIDDMVERGAKGTDQEMTVVLDYLTKNFGPDSKINVNTAPFSELKAILGLTNDETEAVLDYRKKNGNFQQWKDLLRIAGVEGKKIEVKKDLLVF
jgi:competence protein ComEA